MGGQFLEPNILIFICIILIASILQSSTGFGFSIMATPFLLMIFSPQEAIQINIILSLMISLALVRKLKADVDVKLFKRLTIGSLAGVPFGISIYLSMDLVIFKLFISLLLLVLTMLLICRVKVKATSVKDYIVGGLSGILTTSIGMPGPPIMIYFTGTGVEKAKLRATTLTFYLFIYFISFVTQTIFTGTHPVVWTSSFYAVPIVFLGMLGGQIVFKWLHQRAFEIFTYLLLSCTGFYLLIDSLRMIYG